MEDTQRIPELVAAHYYTEVMRLCVGKSELQYDLDLLEKARNIGIMATLPSVSESSRVLSIATSDSTESTSRDPALSSISDASTIAYLTPHSSIYGAPSPKLSSIDASITKSSNRSLNFAPYDKFLTQIDMVQENLQFGKSATSLESSGQSIFSVSTRKSISDVTIGFRNRMRLRKKAPRMLDAPVSCFTCHAPFNRSRALQCLPCGHAKCTDCLRNAVTEAASNEARMPPSCCARAIPADVLQDSLDIDTQESFLRAVIQYSTPMESRIFCSNNLCGEFIPALRKIDISMPFTVTCLKCQTRVCSMCKHGAHPMGMHCPGDWELLDALKIGGKGSWRRCFKCRKLVELTDADGPVTCICTAQFCLACGGVWDPSGRCSNVCNGEEGLAAKRKEEERLAAEAESALEAEQDEIRKRTAAHPLISALKMSQEEELRRFLVFRASSQSSMKTRHAAEELVLMGTQNDEEEAMSADHLKATSQLEDQEIAEELDLRTTLEQAARSIKVRIRHMEAYCDGLGKNPSSSSSPPRVVTEKNLRDLGHQYNLRDDLERQHQSKINMMRDRQAKRMEDLVQQQDEEIDALAEKQQVDKNDLHIRISQEREIFKTVFELRQSRYTARWNLALELRCKELQEQDGLKYGMTTAPSWPESQFSSKTAVVD